MSEMIYGIHAVQALLERAPERFQEVFILKGREDKRLMPLIHALEAQGVVIQVANRQYLDEKSEGAVHQGIIARVKPGRQYRKTICRIDRQSRSAFLLDPRWRHRSTQSGGLPA